MILQGLAGGSSQGQEGGFRLKLVKDQVAQVGAEVLMKRDGGIDSRASLQMVVNRNLLLGVESTTTNSEFRAPAADGATEKNIYQTTFTAGGAF